MENDESLDCGEGKRNGRRSEGKGKGKKKKVRAEGQEKR